MLLNFFRDILQRRRRRGTSGSHAAAPADPIGDLLRAQRPEAALSEAKLRLAADSANPLLHYQAGTAALILGDTTQAENFLQAALALQPQSAEAHVALGAALQRSKRLGAALEHYATAARLQPARGEILGYMGNMQFQLGFHEDAVASYRRALELEPANDSLHSNLLLAMNSLPTLDRSALFEAHRNWGRLVEARLGAIVPAPHSDPRPERPLRVGYVSADFRNHSVAQFIAPIWSHIDRSRYATVVYDNHAGEPDDMSRRLRLDADAWIRVSAMTDDDLAARIQEDRIDILVDLSGHTSGNRLPVFARHPAPVQVTWFAYMNTTGLSAMQYRITDYWLAPAGEDRFYVEKLARLPACACWAPAPESGEVNALPAAAKGSVTFGSFNNWTKVTPEVMETWSRILRAVEGSRLVAVIQAGGEEQVRREVLAAFGSFGIAPERVDIVPTLPLKAFLRVFHDIDIALDSFPYAGGTTSLHTLWMGVPIVAMGSLAETGRTAGGILWGVGAPELLAQTKDEYVAIASDLALDLPRLAAYRRTLRTRMHASPVMQANEVARSVEQAFRCMWRDQLERVARPIAL